MTARNRVDVVFAAVHSDADYINQMRDFLGLSPPRVFNLARCWNQPLIQNQVLKTISAQYRDTVFVAFRIPQLVLASSVSEIIEQSIRAAVNTTRYPEAPRYMFLAQLCTVSNKQSVIFERGVGPLQVVYENKAKCCCGQEYASSTSSPWWNKDEASLVYRKRCRDSTSVCLDVLEVRERGRAIAFSSSSSSNMGNSLVPRLVIHSTLLLLSWTL